MGSMKYLTVAILIAAGAALLWFGGRYAPKMEKQPELKIEDLTVGTGEEVQKGDYLLVNYVGTLDDGAKFDSSDDHGQPLLFQFGMGQVIQGWELGFAGMKVGGKRRLTVPPELGYGAVGNGPIPPNSTLHFDVELVSIQRKVE